MKNILKCRLVKFLPSMQSINGTITGATMFMYVFGQIGLSKQCRPRLESTLSAASTSTNNKTNLINLYHSLGIFSRRQIDDIFLIFPRKQDLTFHAKTINMKFQILFSGKNKKIISKCRPLKILPRVLSVKFRTNVVRS